MDSIKNRKYSPSTTFDPSLPYNSLRQLFEHQIRNHYHNWKDLNDVYKGVKLIAQLTKMESGMWSIPFTILIPYLERELGITSNTK